MKRMSFLLFGYYERSYYHLHRNENDKKQKYNDSNYVIALVARNKGLMFGQSWLSLLFLLYFFCCWVIVIKLLFLLLIPGFYMIVSESSWFRFLFFAWLIKI